MICPLCPPKNKKLAPSRLKTALPATSDRAKTYPLDHNELWSPITAGPYIVPISRWIE
jgi:hypothetical protein